MMLRLPHGIWKDIIRSVILDRRRDLLVAQAKGRGPLVSQAKGKTRWSLKQTCQLLMCILRPLHYFTIRVPATEERYVRNLSDCIPTYTQASLWMNKNRLYVYISNSPSLFVQRCNLRGLYVFLLIWQNRKKGELFLIFSKVILETVFRKSQLQ